MAQISKKMNIKRGKLVDVKKMEAKKAREEEIEEICVVGYQCKLFRDDERARAIDRGDHLIPWMGDSWLMIDRYDGRGHLPSLAEFESFGWSNRDQEMSTEEERIEALCDEERYMSLHKDMMKEEQRQEEEIKRLNLAIALSDDSYMYNEVAFSYKDGADEYDPMKPTEDEEQFSKTPPQSISPELEEPFIAPAELNIPIGIQMPGTKKTHKFMEKTAMFIMSQGAQMEIILKTKQANNPQFAFLQFDHYLNPYYKHLLKYIKTGKYRPSPEDEEDESGRNHREQGGNNRVRRQSRTGSDNGSDQDDSDDDNDNSGYLHPSLRGLSRPRPTPMQTGTTTIPTTTSQPQVSGYHTMDYGHPPMVMGYHDPNLMPPAASSATDMSVMGASGYYDPQGVYPMYPPPPPPHSSEAALSLPSVPPPHHYPSVDPSYVLSHHAHSSVHGLDPHVLPHHEVPSMAAPGSAPTDVGDSDVPLVLPPPPDIQPVIDKLAKFVAKNGSDFEASVRTKSDPRFDFLNTWHKYNAYYVQKKRMYIAEMGGKLEDAEEETMEKIKKVSVSFSIKPKLPKEERPLERKSALPVESSESEDEESDTQPSSRIPPPSHLKAETRNVTGVESQSSWDDSRLPGQPSFHPAFRDHLCDDPGEPNPRERAQSEDGAYGEPTLYSQNPSLGYLEYPDPYTDQDPSKMAHDRERMTEEEWHMKQVKMRLEDKLSTAAREKMASASKERIQQMERRKKAAMFLSMVKDRPQAGAVAELDTVEPGQEDIPAEAVGSPPEKHRKTEPRSERKKHKKHKHKHGSRRSPSPHRKHKRPPRSYQDPHLVNRDGVEVKLRSRSISPGGRSRGVTPPRSYQMARYRSPKRRRRSRSRSTSPLRLPRALGSPPRRSSSLGAPSLPNKSQSQSPENNRKDSPATGTVSPAPLSPTAMGTPPPMATPPPTALPPPSATIPTVTQENSDSDSSKEMTKAPSTQNGSVTGKESSFQENFRAKIRAMLAETRQMDPS